MPLDAAQGRNWLGGHPRRSLTSVELCVLVMALARNRGWWLSTIDVIVYR